MRLRWISGSAGRQRDPRTGKIGAYCFIMKLSYLWHMYGDIVFDEKMATWIRCHRNAFESFGGVPEEVVVDNLKAAVLEASLENQTLSIPYKRFAAHYAPPYIPAAHTNRNTRVRLSRMFIL